MQKEKNKRSGYLTLYQNFGTPSSPAGDPRRSLRRRYNLGTTGSSKKEPKNHLNCPAHPTLPRPRRHRWPLTIWKSWQAGSPCRASGFAGFSALSSARGFTINFLMNTLKSVSNVVLKTVRCAPVLRARAGVLSNLSGGVFVESCLGNCFLWKSIISFSLKLYYLEQHL